MGNGPPCPFTCPNPLLFSGGETGGGKNTSSVDLPSSRAQRSDLNRSGGINPSGNGNRIQRSSTYPFRLPRVHSYFRFLFIPVCTLAVTTKPVIGRPNIFLNAEIGMTKSFLWYMRILQADIFLIPYQLVTFKIFAKKKEP